MLPKTDYDVIIVGGGPAGLTGGMYCGRAKLRTLIIEQATIGGTITNVERVENFPGFPDGISGSDLAARMTSQAIQFGAELKRTEVNGIELIGDIKCVNTSEDDYSAQTLIIASGARPKKLSIPGTKNVDDIKLSYCAFCDGSYFKDQNVAVIGGGESGITEALYLARLASKVTIIEILPKLGVTPILSQRAQNNSKIEILCSTVVESIDAKNNLRNITLKNTETGKLSTLRVSGVFVLIGRVPNTEYLKDLLALDSSGRIIVNRDMAINVPGIFAAGDIRSGSPGQLITAAADGAVAGLAAEKFLSLWPD